LGCSDDPSSVGLNQVPAGDLASFKTVNTDSLVQTYFFYKDTASFYDAERLILGRNGIAQSSVLLKFNFANMQDSILEYIADKKISIKSAKVHMTPDYTIGTGDLPFTAYKLNDYWTTYFNADSLFKLSSLNQEVSVPGSFIYSDSLYTFNLNTDVVLNWMKAQEDSTLPQQQGIYLKDNLSQGQNRALGFLKSTGISLRVVYDTPLSKSDTLDIGLSRQLHVVQMTDNHFYPKNSGYLYVQGGVTVSGFLKFYFPTIPKNAIVNYAQLEIPYDSTLSSMDTKNQDLLAVNYNMIDSAEIAAGKDSVNGIGYLKKSGDGWFKGDISLFANEWFTKTSTMPNKGLRISFSNGINSIDLIALITEKNSAVYGGKKPRVKIYYSVP
jgi:hypothetical protein